MAEKATKAEKKKPAENVLPLFGASIEEAAKRSDREHGAIPLPIKSAVEYLNQRGLKEEGLYRVPGNAQKFAEYKQQFDEVLSKFSTLNVLHDAVVLRVDTIFGVGKHVDFIALDERSPENVAMVIVKYLQMLPDPLLTRKWEQHFKVALGIDSSDPKERYHVIRAILLRLPYANRETVRILALHLKQVAQHSGKNKMTARNIELTWSLSVGAVVGAVMRVLVETEAPPPSTIIFGLPVLEACRNSEIADSIGPFVVPAPISRSWDWFRQKQGWSNDLFTKFSDTEIPALLKSSFNSGDHSFPENATGLDVATFVRNFIVEIPESIFSDRLHDDFGAVADLRTPAEQVARLRDLFSQLHPVYRHTLKCLTQFLLDIMSHSTTMSSFSIAFAFGDRYVDKIPLLIDNAATLFGPENDVTQLPWFDISKAPSQSSAGMVSFSIGGAAPTEESSENVPMTFSIGETTTNGTPKPKKPREKRSKHAADSPGAPVQRTSSGKLKRVKSEAELSGTKIKKTSKRTVMSHESDMSEPATPPPAKREKKKSHDKIKSEDVRPKIRELKKRAEDGDSSPQASRPHKKRADSDTVRVPTPSAEEQQAVEGENLAELPGNSEGAEVSVKSTPKDKTSKRSSSKRMSDKKKDKEAAKVEAEESPAEVKKSKRTSDRRPEQKEAAGEDGSERKKKHSSDRRKAKESPAENDQTETSSRKSSKKSHSREKSAEGTTGSETRSDSPSRKKYSKKNMKTL